MKRILPYLVPLLVAACGADGPPVPPSQAALQNGLQISGQARVGVVGSM